MPSGHLHLLTGGKQFLGPRNGRPTSKGDQLERLDRVKSWIIFDDLRDPIFVLINSKKKKELKEEEEEEFFLFFSSVLHYISGIRCNAIKIVRDWKL